MKVSVALVPARKKSMGIYGSANCFKGDFDRTSSFR